VNLAPVCLLVALLCLGLACTGDSTPAPTAAMPTSTAAVEATTRPEVTPARPPTAAVSPRATSVPASPSPEQSPLPTPTATPRPDGLEFHFGPSVSDFDRSLIVRAVEVTGELLQPGAEVRPPTAVFADASTQRLEQAFAEEAAAQQWRSQGMAQRMTQALAEASYRGIVINTGSPAWLEMNATQRLRVVAHEFVHVIQLEQSGKQVADATFLAPAGQVPPMGPFWLLEGSAEVVSWLVLQELGLGSYADSLFDYAEDAAAADVELEELSSFIGLHGDGNEGLGLAVLATDYLLRSRSLDALFDFWREIGDGAEWSSAFTREFGQPPAFFYIAFATYYQSTWAGFSP